MRRFASFAIMLAILFPFLSCTAPKTPKADVVIWHWMADRQEAFDKLAEKYQKETGIKVIFETYAPSEVYKDKVETTASGKLLPEVFSPLGDKRELASYIKKGYIADLTDEMNKGWKNDFFEKPLFQNTMPEGNEWGVKPGIYGVPIDVSSIQIYYNIDLFKQAGLNPEKPPKTWKEFIAAGKKLRAAGIQPFVCGFGEGWLLNVFISSYEWNVLGKEGIIDTFKGKVAYTDPRWGTIFKLIEEMKDNDLFGSEIATMINKDAERAFGTGKAAMALNGSWGVNVYFNMNPSLKYGIMMPPKVEGSTYPIAISGGEGSSFNVNALSPNKDKAIAFMKWLTAKDQQVFLSEQTRNIPSNKLAASNLSPVLKQFTANINSSMEPLPVVEDWPVVNAMTMRLQAIITGEKKAGQAAQEIQEEKMRQLNAKQYHPDVIPK
jgi:raffinose/stachyose/melibiose transport system substrate-binding protein